MKSSSRSIIGSLVLAVCGCVAGRAPLVQGQETVLADFEDGYGQWTATGDAFGKEPAEGTLPNQQEVSGFIGRRLVNTYRGGDAATGTLESPPLTLAEPYLVFLIGGGDHPGQVGIELLHDGNVVHQATGRNQELLHWVTWDVRSLAGEEVRLRIFDRATGDFGHINVDQILASTRPRRGSGTYRLEEYRKAPEYYREAFRPQFHFSPELNWTNDPNGLVFFQGEYHLFYQFNPHGASWGHMSWGHAVSSDLVHWEHLPIALHEEFGVMAFSGSAVVDWQNTSGFGSENEPPLVAIYTGHGHGKQTQDLAYSRDRGRTWVKYPGNPVLDLQEADFRDPKVFWHAPTERWVMVVSLAAQRKLQLYGSKNLRQWELLSEFGPAGAPNKPNWECPDLFELPIEGEPGKTRWVLEVDMGSGAIAGGSGSEYFVGNFDGTTFRCEHPLTDVKWVDYGRDFYAPVSWSDIPTRDGRRIWIGWMNNWETSNLPVAPWRGAMSIPRSLSLRRHRGDLVLIQRPVVELQQLRKDPLGFDTFQLTAEDAERTLHVSPPCEIELEFVPNPATRFQLELFAGDSQRTVVGYDAAAQEVFIDRRESGKVDFAPAFAGVHRGPLSPRDDGSVRLHLFVDTSSVEVFANDGITVITDRIFPAAAQNRIRLRHQHGGVRITSLKAWSLASIWHAE